MPARTKKIRHDEDTRSKIQAAQIINRLNDHINGKVSLDVSQVSAAKVLLNKVLPDLKAVELMGQGGGPIKTVTKVVLSAPSVTEDDDDSQD
jgi:hypothetical protein